MDAAGLGHRTEVVLKALFGFCAWAHGGATCPASFPTAQPAGGVCDDGKKRGVVAGLASAAGAFG